MANKIDTDLLEAAKTGTQKVTIQSNVDGIQKAMDIFNDEDDSVVVLLVSPKNAAAIRADANKQKIGSDVGATDLINGTYANILGVQIVRSRKLSVNVWLADDPG